MVEEEAPMSFTTRLNLILIAGVALVTLWFGVYQTSNQDRSLRRDLERQAVDLAVSLERSVEPLLNRRAAEKDLRSLVERFQNRERLAGIVVYDARRAPLAVTPDLSTRLLGQSIPLVPTDIEQEGKGTFVQIGDTPMHVFAIPVLAGEERRGYLAIFHDVSFLGRRVSETWKRVIVALVVQTGLILLVTPLLLRRGLRGPLARLTEWLGEIRRGSNAPPPKLPGDAAFAPLSREMESLAVTLASVRAAAEEEARLRDASESRWTPERLRVCVQNKLGASRLFVVSNREPYEHLHDNGEIKWSVPASGLVTALEPILQACDGTWIAQGTGDADRASVDEHDHIRVPPDDPQYTLRRVFLTREAERGFYLGFANEGLWPLCHIAHTRPVFRAPDWEFYRQVNRRFADVLLQEMKGADNPVVCVQDYHFALVPRMVKEARPDARVAIFWHIPWPNPEAFGICPWQRDLLDGLLGADLIGFHLQSHCNNFADTVDRALECRIDREHFAINRGGRTSYVKPFPISVSFQRAAESSPQIESPYVERARLLSKLGVEASMLGIGVDRIDYTKGLLERFGALEVFFEKYPAYRNQFTFVQIGAPSRTEIARYRELMSEVQTEADRINRRFETASWRPIVLLSRHHSRDQIMPYYRTADLCLVTSLHDGMNLVAKEYVASRNDEQGVLILSPFAGASHELADALIANPYDSEALADAIHRALAMAPEEKHARMVRMRTYVREHNIYHWAGTLITQLASLRLDADDWSARAPSELTAYAGER
jgi:alpha,alpha-trehalose-phosphate synthase [UDP-forming]